jgi:hypothetical protein
MATTKVGKGIPGFGSSKGSTNRRWDGKEPFIVEIGEITHKIKVTDGEDTGVNVTVPVTFLGGPKQADGTDPKGKKTNLFINVNYDLSFTVDQLMDLFLAAGVKPTSGDQPPYEKLEGKTAKVNLFLREKDGETYQGVRWIDPARAGGAKAKARKSASSDDDD